MTTTPKPAGLAAIDTICLLMEDFTPEQKELLVDSIHDIVDDVIDSSAVCVGAMSGFPWQGQRNATVLTNVVGDYVSSHYGKEEFGL